MTDGLGGERPLAERLEAGEVAAFPPGEFPLPDPETLALLRAVRLAPGWKNVRWDCGGREVAGGRGVETAALAGALESFAESAGCWLGQRLREYAGAWVPDQVTLRPQEEQGRTLPWRARNDRLHVDAFPGRPSRGRRILRFFVNLSPDAPRVWVTGPGFPELLARYGPRLEQAPPPGVLDRLRDWLAGPAGPQDYDRFMLRLHDVMKRDPALPHATGRRLEFPPGASWVAFTDAVSHAVLSGRWALEHSWFVPVGALARPEDAPIHRRARDFT